MKRVSAYWLSVVLVGSLGCAAAPPRSCVLTAKPQLRHESIPWHLFDVTVLSQAQRLWWRPARATAPSAMAGKPAPEGSFFINRNIPALTPEQISRGPTPESQRPAPPFLITKLKEEGKTAGCFVLDANRHRYLFKFDVVEYPELLTGAEVVSSKLLHALGYHVPSYDILEFAPSDLAAHPEHEVAQEELDELMQDRIVNGRVRVSATRLLEGDVLGPFRFKDFRDCPALRALRLASAWLNNTDTKDHNTLMVWTGERAIGYLIDFGTSLGAEAEHGPKHPCQGWVYDVDFGEGFWEFLTLGLHDDGCNRREPLISPALGRFPERFDPRRWKPYAPNLAFQAMTEADGRWMAKRIGQFSRAQLEAAIAAGRYHDREDAQRLVEILETRRARIAEAYAPPQPATRGAQ